MYLYNNFLEALLWHCKIQIFQGLDKTFGILPEGGLGITFNVLQFSKKKCCFLMESICTMMCTYLILSFKLK